MKLKQRQWPELMPSSEAKVKPERSIVSGWLRSAGGKFERSSALDAYIADSKGLQRDLS